MTAHVWKATAAIGLVAGPLLLWSDSRVVHDAIWIVTMTLTVIAVAVGIFLHRPRHPVIWWLLAGGFTLFAVSIAVSPSALDLPAGDPRSVLGEGLGMLGFLLLGVVAHRFVRYQTPKGDRDGLVDAMIVMIAFTTMLWTVAFGAELSEMLWTGRVALAVALLVPAWVGALCVRLLLTSGGQVTSARLLSGAGLTLFVVSRLWVLREFAGVGIPEAVMDLTWLGVIVATTATPLHPSMRRLSEPAPAVVDAVSSGRLVVLGLALIAVPAALLQVSDAVDVNIVVPVGGSAVLAVLILLRLARLVADRERARREVAVRAAHQAALSRLASDALSNHALTELYEDAEQLLDTAVDGATTRIHTGMIVTPPQPSADRLQLPITGMDGPVAMIEVVSDPDTELDGEARQFLHAVADVLASAVQRRQIEVELEHRATHDPLTGLPNRVQLFDRLEQALLRRGDQRVGLLYIDLDGFKPVNDTYGHEAGDRVLVTVAERMSTTVRAADTVARLAGDEFVVLVDPSTPEELKAVADRLLDRLAEPIEADGSSVSLAASIGAVLSGPTDRHPEALLRRADEAMYDAKQRPETAVVLAEHI